MAGYYPTNTNVWNQWNQIYYQGTTAANTVYAAQIWQNWNYQYQTTVVSYGGITNGQPPPSQQELDQLKAAKLRRDQAQVRAKEILVSMLDDNQKQQFEKENVFELQVNDRLYRIWPGHGVYRLNPKTRQVESSFCIHPSHSYELPAEDVALGQKLLLEADEKQFLKIANETRAA